MCGCHRMKVASGANENSTETPTSSAKFVLLEAASKLTGLRRLVYAVSSSVYKVNANQPPGTKDRSDHVVTAAYNWEQTGFTLVEVLIGLVLLSMVVAIVFGSLGQVLDARSRLRPYLDQSEETALVASWFRQTVQALVADYETGKDRFAATADGFSGLTASPLVGPPGTPTPFRWSLRYDAGANVTILEYAERPSNAIRISSWAGHDAIFSYYDQDRQWQRVWPPADSHQSQGLPQLPKLVRLGGLAADVFPTIVAAPRTSPVPRPLPPSILGGVVSQN
jgi:prepilin-type N-terminal cleavage/methylation domain-containing protein